MRQKNVKKKTVSLLLAAAMILTSFPVSGKEARAAGTSDRSLSVEAFATKEQLMSAFAPDGNGSSSATGKIAFGKNSTSAVQEWYILGKDNGVTGDNTVLFAAGPIATNQKFDENYNISDETTATKSYNTEWGCAYTGNAPTEVNANHYGGSGVRAKLKEIAGSAQYFTTAEQGLMNGTTVTTHDAKADADYTTTDKLYALTAENSGSSYRTIKAGTNDQIVLAMSTYWSSGSRFWLRAPNSNFSHFARVAVPGSYVYDINVNLGYALVPAFDLNLSSVIFASAAKAASSGNAETGTIANGTAMTLRLDGSDKTIGTVVYDDAAGKITAQKDAGAAGTVSLMVQGNDGNKDWYYSVPAGEATVVTKEQIQTACGISGDISLADCKIWLEKTMDNVAYARRAVVTITDSMITLASGPHYYTGSAVTPAVTVKDGSKTLVSGTDYTVSYKNNTNVGTATVTVTGKGNYTGTIGKTFDIILTDADKVAAAKRVVEETLAGITATNGMTKQEIQDKIDEALTQAGMTEVTVTVGELEKTEATTEAAGSISGNISIISKNDFGETESVPIIKTIEKLPKTEAEKVADAKKVVEDVLEEVLAGITTASEVTKEGIQREIEEALTQAGITEVTVTVGDLDRTEATTEAEGSISGSITIVSDNDSDVTDSVPINKTIEQLPTHTHTWTWVITKAATTDEEGEMTGTCICGEVTTETIPKTGESGSGTVIVKEDAENECNGSLEDKEDVKGKVSLTDTEKDQLNTGEDLVIILRLKDVSVAADTQEKTEIQNNLETNTLGTFLDIELLKQIGGTETKITETTDEIEITFEIPENLRNTDDTVTRTYQIMRHHDGVVDILDVENYDETAHLLTFKTDKFSTYALVYRDAVKNPTATPEPTPGATETPEPTDTPDTPSPTPGTTDTPDTPSPTPGTTDTPDTPAPTPDTPIEVALENNTLSLNALLNVSQPGKKINIAWGKVAGADGYDVYVQYCGKEFTNKSITAIKSGKTTKVTVKKINGKALNQKRIYKIYVLAYKLVDGKKVTLAKTITAHIAGKKNAKYTNVKAVKVKKSSYSLKQAKTTVIKASTVLVSKGKKQLSDAHAKEFRYATDNKEVATVSKKGKIRAIGKGSCIIYVYARNGYAKKIKVKVK